ncbi:MAG: hypothetical protein AAB966_01540, partial [Patescibacteria group bacterium]
KETYVEGDNLFGFFRTKTRPSVRADFLLQIGYSYGKLFGVDVDDLVNLEHMRINGRIYPYWPSRS